MPYISGTCGIGCHEGTSPKNYRGAPLPTCTSRDVCECSCHTDLDAMFKMSEMERITVDRSGYTPDRGDFVMPDMAALAESRRLADVSTPAERIESPAPDVVPATVRRTFAPTASGRSGRGELEQQVDDICKIWAVERDVAICSPKHISEEIASKYAINAPSVGAIGAVFDRWVKIEYADCQRKPVRFVGFTDLAREIGLEGCKERARRAKAKVAR